MTEASRLALLNMGIEQEDRTLAEHVSQYSSTLCNEEGEWRETF